ncbi:hypothetical protein [Microcoleus sp. FACHB-672]|uniref:hypothetical protein n=1 Tax=Microcoleus sp. FACHB-672 TaxID=2692825 RepID=UPI001687F54D|nr:hypothetical protein [Microcoleus sp. FACHB-672]MBD2039841.1 hypothetical protein [Microcoleus sp. FACHB-672]
MIQVDLSKPAAGAGRSQSENCHRCRPLKRATPSRRILIEQGFTPSMATQPRSSRPVVSRHLKEVPQDFPFSLLRVLN